MAQTFADYKAAINVEELTTLVRHNPQPTKAFAQAAGAPTGRALGMNKGDTVKYDFFPDVDTQGGELSETEEIPSTGLDPIAITYLVKEYGNAMKWTGKLEDLSRLSLEDNFMVALMNDWKKLENDRAYTEAIGTLWKFAFIAAGDEFVKTGTLAGTADEDLSLDNLSAVKTRAKLEDIPKFDGESYLYLTGVEAIEALYSDSDLSTLLKEDSGRAALNGEIGRVRECRVVEDNHKITDHLGGFNEGVLLGADAIATDIAHPIEIRREIKDFGRSVGVAYYFMGAWYRVLQQATHGRSHAIHVSSA